VGDFSGEFRAHAKPGRREATKLQEAASRDAMLSHDFVKSFSGSHGSPLNFLESAFLDTAVVKTVVLAVPPMDASPDFF
jgi:hypothetical protein